MPTPTPGGTTVPSTPTLGQQQPPPTPGEGTATTTGRTQLVEELSPIERLLAGGAIDPTTPLRQFGYDLFVRPPTTFAPVTDVPVGPDYVIGPGDALNILLWGGIQEAYQVEVDRNGAIALPRLGVLQVWGMTIDQVQRLLQQRFSAFYSDFQMAVTLGKLRTILVYVVGEVQQPGSYTVSSLSTIINALFASGGPTKNGSLRRMQLVRQGRPVHTLDLYNFLLKGDKQQDLPLQSGDTILVPLIGPVAGVAGNVKRPAIYEIEPGTTLRQLFELAGSITPLAYLQRVQVERVIANEKRVVVDFNLSVQQQPPRQDLWQTSIAAGDLVRVFSILPNLENAVQLEGHVLRPGRYELKPGMRLRDLLPSYNVLQPEPYLDYAEILRYVEPDLRRTVVPFNLGALLSGDATQNLLLHPQDTVRIFARADFIDPQRVQILGMVHRPGDYPLTPGMRVSDLIFRAGGFQKLAHLEKAELTRHRISQQGDTAVRVEIDLARAMADDVEHNLLLEDFDQLVVRPIPDFELNRTVELSGEVRFPGPYPVQKGERLSSVLRRAGGFTPNAYPRGAVFTRTRVKEEQTRRLQELVREQEATLLAQGATGTQAALSGEEAQIQRQSLEQQRLLLERLRGVEPDGRVVIRLASFETFAGSAQDIELEPGDRLSVPAAPKYVNVLGEVYNRVALVYEPQRTIGDYLNKVGGVKPDADTDQIYLVQLDGTVISNTQNQFAVVLASGQTMRFKDFFRVQPQPGDSIIVPRRIVTSATLRNLRDIVQIVFQSVSSLAVIAAVVAAL